MRKVTMGTGTGTKIVNKPVMRCKHGLRCGQCAYCDGGLDHATEIGTGARGSAVSTMNLSAHKWQPEDNGWNKRYTGGVVADKEVL